MRAGAVALAAAGFGVASLLILAGGQRLSAIETPSVEMIDEDEAIDAEPPADPGSTEAIGDAVAEPNALDPSVTRPVEPGVVALPPVEQGGFMREEPRAPLSELSLALPPKPKMTAEWDGTALFQPVASAAGLIKAKDLDVAIAGVIPLDASETCSFEGKQWNCGVRARTAFRGLLRGRAVVCDVPADARQGEVVAKCRVGKQDLGEWLVANGWVRAEDGGPYVEAGQKAEAENKGIFGPPPERIEMTLSPSGSSLPAGEEPLPDATEDAPIE